MPVVQHARRPCFCARRVQGPACDVSARLTLRCWLHLDEWERTSVTPAGPETSTGTIGWHDRVGKQSLHVQMESWFGDCAVSPQSEVVSAEQVCEEVALSLIPV